MTKRIDVIDGWRAIAAVGVLYGHILGTLNNPTSSVFGIDILKILSIWGRGVHLFFVISGFCFFLVMDKKKDFSFSGAVSFWKKRWIRIAPAFYTACIVYGIYYYESIKDNLIVAYLANFLFVQTYVPHTEIAAHFWSLSVEWLFYLSLPIIFFLISKSSYLKVIFSILIFGLFLNVLHYLGYIYPGDFAWYYTFFANFEHFGWGILLGFLYKRELFTNSILKNPISFILGLCMAYAGKIFFFSGFVVKMGKLGFIFESIGPLVMTLGFSIMIISSLYNSFLNKLIGNKVFVFIGRISYSFYLWHVLVLMLLHNFAGKYFHDTPGGVVTLFVVSLTVLLPISYLSYKLLEEFYFKLNNKQ